MEVPLGKTGLITIVSGCDYAAVRELQWSPSRRESVTYARTNIWLEIAGQRVRRTLYLHHFIASPPPKLEVHHRDHNGLHNWRSNLVVCRHARNLSERRSYGTSDLIGVSRCRNRWRASITVEGLTRSYSKHLGVFGTALEAARAYDEEALRRFGPYANCNFPLETYDASEEHSQPAPFPAEKAHS